MLKSKPSTDSAPATRSKSASWIFRVLSLAVFAGNPLDLRASPGHMLRALRAPRRDLPPPKLALVVPMKCQGSRHLFQRLRSHSPSHQHRYRDKNEVAVRMNRRFNVDPLKVRPCFQAVPVSDGLSN